MKIVKYVFSGILICIGLIISSEKYQLYLSSFQSFYSISFSCDNRDEYPIMLQDIQTKSDGYDIDIFYVVTEYQGNYDSNVAIYCSEKTKQRLIEVYRYVPGTTKSVFFGQTQVEYRDFLELPYEQFVRTCCAGYVFGDYDKLMAYKRALIDAYGGAYPKPEGRNELKESKILICLSWIIILGIIIGCTYFTRLAGQKEFFVRASVGDTMLRRAIALAVFDSAINSVLFFIGVVIWRFRFGRVFFFKEILILFAIFLFANSLVFLRLPFTKFRYAMSNATVSEELVGTGYVFQSVIMVILLLSISAGVIAYIEYKSIKTQEWFYRKYDGYKYVTFLDTNVDHCKEKEAEFYSEYLDKYDIGACILFGKSQDYEVCVLNRNMRWYLEKLLSDEHIFMGESVVCLYPDGVSIEEIERFIYPLQTTVYGANENDTVQYVSYSDRICVINQADDSYRGCISPIILYNPYHGFDQRYDSRDKHALRLNRYFVHCDEDVVRLFAQENDLGIYIRDVFDEYDYFKTTLRRIFVTSTVFSIALFLLGCVLSGALVRAEFESRKMEIAILKTMGMSNWYRYKKIYLITAISGFLSCFGAVIISKVTGYGNPYAVLLLGLAIIVLDLAFLQLFSIRIESFEVSKTLKNG